MLVDIAQYSTDVDADVTDLSLGPVPLNNFIRRGTCCLDVDARSFIGMIL